MSQKTLPKLLEKLIFVYVSLSMVFVTLKSTFLRIFFISIIFSDLLRKMNSHAFNECVLHEFEAERPKVRSEGLKCTYLLC